MLKINKFSLILCPFLFITHHFFAQDLRDYEHTEKFANYLFQTKQYSLASEEYERLVYYNPSYLPANIHLFQSYRLSGKFQLALTRFNTMYSDSIYTFHKDLAEEYVKNMFLEKKNTELIEYLNLNKTLEQSKKENYILSSLLLQKKWDSAFQFATIHPVTTDKKNAYLHVYAFRSQNLNYKKPGVAALMSTIIPGSGKVYTKNWKDGLISFMLVGLNSWQAYRGFNKYGQSSVYGWVFAGLAGGFYIGNIFGSHKSAKKYNAKLDEDLYDETWHLVVDDF